MYSKKTANEPEFHDVNVWCEDRDLLSELFSSIQEGAGNGVEAGIGKVRASLREPELQTSWQNWFAPLAKLEGCWLLGAVTIKNAHTKLGADLLELQRVFFQESRSAAACQDFLHQTGRSPEDIRWLDALGREGWRFPAAVVGVTLAHAELGGGLFAVVGRPDYQQTLALAERLLNIWPTEGEEWGQAMSAKAWYRRMTLGWCQRWLAEIPLGARVLAMFRAKAKYGQGYHRKILVGNRNLDVWLEALDRGEGGNFLQLFLDSPYFDRQHPEASRFFCHSTTFGGPMFGVFSRSEQALLQRWLHSSAFSGVAVGQKSRSGENAGGRNRDRGPSSVGDRFPVSAERLSPPLLYHRLINEIDPEVTLPAAKRWVDRILGRAGWFRKGFFPYSQKEFCLYIDGLHRQACRQPSQSGWWPHLSRAAWVWGIEQFAPAILVDGSWLTGSLPIARQLPELGEKLWRIWRDELGDGSVEKHHGNLYRHLLETAGVDLPAFDSEAFIRHPGFITGAFDLPAFLLAIGRLHRIYLPEILGLNLAIELSGLGRRYQSLAEEMETVGLDGTIVRLHQSIDNLACGHAALARDAIIVYLQRFEVGGEAAVQNQWHRIWTGWQALTPASLRFGIHLLAGWARRFGGAAWMGGMRHAREC